MATPEAENLIVTLHRLGWSSRRIAKETGVARNTVRRILARIEQQRSEGHTVLPDLPVRRGSQLDAHEAFLRELLERHPDATAVRVHEELQKQGFVGGYTIVKDWLRRYRPVPKQEPVARLETPPGQQGQQDWSPYTVRFTRVEQAVMQCFSLVLSYSRRHYLDFGERQDFYSLIRQHECAFDRFGGVPEEILYDRQKAVVLGRENGRDLYNPKFLAFATHYGFTPVALPPRKPGWKGKVEKPFQHVESHLLNARDFRDPAHLREFTTWWLDHVSDPHPHRRTGEPPLVRFERDERDRLLPLPAHPFDTAEVGYRVVDREGFVLWDTVPYAAPYALLLDLVVVRATADEVVIYGPDLRPAARHARRPRGQRDPVDDGHVHRAARKRVDVELLVARMGALGASAATFAAGVCRRHRTRGEHLLAVLALQERYSLDDLVAALDRAVRYGAFDAGVVTRILEASATPRVLPDTLAQAAQRRLREDFAHTAVRPRDMADFADAIGDDDEE